MAATMTLRGRCTCTWAYTLIGPVARIETVGALSDRQHAAVCDGTVDHQRDYW